MFNCVGTRLFLAIKSPVDPARNFNWSHVLLDVETRWWTEPSAENAPASMEPRPIGRGNMSGSSWPVWRINASMEPRPIGRGNEHTPEPGRIDELLQWSHVLLDVET